MAGWIEGRGGTGRGAIRTGVDAPAHEPGVVIVVVIVIEESDYDCDNDNDNEGAADGISVTTSVPIAPHGPTGRLERARAVTMA